MNEKISVAVADDHALFRKGLVVLLQDIGFIHHIYEASNGVELMELLKVTDPLPDIVLLDLRMPVMDGIEATEQIKEQFPEIKIVILTMQDDESMILHLVEKGVNSYLLKNVEPEELETVLSMLRTKEFYFNEKLSGMVVKALYSKGRKTSPVYDAPVFTEREMEILKLICEELTAQEIADVLFISKRTVEGHRNNMMEKAGVKNVAGLVVFAVRHGIYEV